MLTVFIYFIFLTLTQSTRNCKCAIICVVVGFESQKPSVNPSEA